MFAMQVVVMIHRNYDILTLTLELVLKIFPR